MSVNSVASGGQAKRNGAYGEVPQPCADVQRAAPRCSLRPRGAPSIEIAIRYQCAVAGDAQLTAVRVASHDQVCTVRRHRVENSTVGGVGDSERQGRLPGSKGPATMP